MSKFSVGPLIGIPSQITDCIRYLLGLNADWTWLFSDGSYIGLSVYIHIRPGHNGLASWSEV